MPAFTETKAFMVGGEKKEKPSPRMVLDVVPNSKMLLGSPSASNKIAGHPERPQGGERRLLSPLAPGLNNCVQLVPLNHQLSLGPSARLSGPAWPRFSHYAACLVYLQLYLVFGLPEALATSHLVTSPCSVIKRPVHHRQGCLGKLSHIAFGCIQEKQESLVDLFRLPFFNALQVWRFPHTGKCLPLGRTLSPLVLPFLFR